MAIHTFFVSWWNVALFLCWWSGALLIQVVDAAFQERWFQTHIDHYNYEPVRPYNTFLLRYFVDDQYFNASSGHGSILLYTGNEAPIDQFMANSGSLLELARALQAAVVFAEHRYYGKSMPFDDANDSLQPGRNISYLTVEQAMQDFNLLNVELRNQFSFGTTNNNNNIPIIAFGGSYGANLALWLRLKNPNLWAGAISSSATPLKHLLRTNNGFARIETDVYANVSAACPDLVRRGWKELLEMASNEQVQKQLGLCQTPPPDHDYREMLHGWISGALETMVQYGYPYPTQFYNPLPAYPFAEACHRMIQSSQYLLNGTAGLDALRAAVDVYYNYTGGAGPCYNFDEIASHSIQHAVRNVRPDRVVRLLLLLSTIIAADQDSGNGRATPTATTSTLRRQRRELLMMMNTNNDASGGISGSVDYTDRAWSYQTCTEVYQPMPTNGVTDFEVPSTPNDTAYFEACRQLWGVEPRPDWEEMTFMGSDIGTGSNLFLTNGQLDPWRAAGIQWQPSSSSGDHTNDITVRTIEHGAHHYDLRPSHVLDPSSVRTVRQEQKEAIQRWIHDWNRRHPPSTT